MRVKRGRFEVVPLHCRVDSQNCTKTASPKYTVCWVDRKRRSCFCDGLCRRGPTIVGSWAKRFAHTANEPVSRRRNWPSGLTCTTISSVKSSVGIWRFHWARCSKSQKPWAFVGATFFETSDSAASGFTPALPLPGRCAPSLSRALFRHYKPPGPPAPQATRGRLTAALPSAHAQVVACGSQAQESWLAHTRLETSGRRLGSDYPTPGHFWLWT